MGTTLGVAVLTLAAYGGYAEGQATDRKVTKPAAGPAVRSASIPGWSCSASCSGSPDIPSTTGPASRSYAEDVDRQFGPFRGHPVVALARKLRQTQASPTTPA